MLKYYEQKKTQRKEVRKGNGLINSVIFRQQYKENFKSFLILSFVVAALMVLIAALYPMVQDMYAAIPAEMQGFIDAFGGIPENIAEYFSIEGGQLYVLVGVIYAAMLGINLIKREIKDGSAEFLYSQPVSRASIFRTKLSVLILNIILFNIIVCGISLAAIYVIEGTIAFSLVNFLMYFGLATVIQLQIGLIAFSYSGIARRNSSMGMALGLAIFSYFISIISRIAEEVDFLKYVTPFTYIAGKTEGLLTVIENGFSAVDVPTLIGFSIATVLLLVFSSSYFRKNDII